MGNSLMKTPLTAIIFAAVWQFAAVFFPLSESYSGALAAFKMPLMGYVYMVALGLLLSVVTALALAAKPGVMTAVMVFLAFVLTQAAAPNLQSIVFGETSGAMTRADILLGIAALAASMVFLLLMAFLLFKAPPAQAAPGRTPPPPAKYKIKTLHLIIKIVVLPIIYCVLYFVAWYFLLWREQAARVYYGGPEEPVTFAAAIVNILLTDVRQVPMALAVGLLTTAGLLPLLFQMPGKRPLYIATSVLLLAGPAVRMLIPNPLMPDDARMANVLLRAVLAVAFGALAGIILHTSITKDAAPTPARASAPAKAAPAQATAPAGATAAKAPPAAPAAAKK
jgi:uncharacterized membrane protein YhaH (DUF805 family)